MTNETGRLYEWNHLSTNMNPIYYFGYGSNLHPFYMARRLDNPKYLGLGRLKGYKIVFDKKGKDGSGKANVRRDINSLVYGSIYVLNEHDMRELSEQENGYEKNLVNVSIGNIEKDVYTFQAVIDDEIESVPYCWYVDLILAGARYLDIESEYIADLESVICQSDPDEDRSRKFRNIVETINVRVS